MILAYLKPILLSDLQYIFLIKIFIQGHLISILSAHQQLFKSQNNAYITIKEYFLY